MQRQKRPYAIEPLNIEPDKLEQLKQYLNSGIGDANAKKSMMTRVTGRCVMCSSIPTAIVKYKVHGVTRIERYCDECFSKSMQR